ncbi:hypothetical protein DdX_08778 [Ditylenchus destructor]|uniref:Uncharacterized protein n=1 Tax=Ditylenchus destructor TaxID=166010 RepID=A0AAD4N4X7_9BILA|nr:hypothetical protein DdX_08778 [Ditylenchus destructor]
MHTTQAPMNGSLIVCDLFTKRRPGTGLLQFRRCYHNPSWGLSPLLAVFKGKGKTGENKVDNLDGWETFGGPGRALCLFPFTISLSVC